MERLLKLLKDEKGVAAVEYAVLLAGIVTLVMAAIVALRGQIATAIQAVTAALSGGSP